MASYDKKFLAFVLYFFVSTISADPDLSKAEKYEELSKYPLPKSLEPVFYDIRINKIDLESKSRFGGDVTIIAKVKEDTKEIYFHCGKLLTCSVNKIEVVKQNSSTTKIVHTDYNRDTEKFLVVLKESLKKNDEIQINLEFNGDLRKDMIGFYRSSYIDEKKQEHHLAATQFEATSARHAFPCFDEPHLKALFRISLTVPKGNGCLSNMPLMEPPTPTTAAGTVSCRFQPSEKMSTYLAAFVVSDFTSNEKNGQKKIKLWSRDATKKQRDFSLDIANKSLDYFEKTLGQSYTLEKMDLVAVPDFSAGAMENWGLLTFREANLLRDETSASAMDEQKIASVVAHEIAHMWFGNLVTPAKWNYLWLSEGFARYFQYMAIDKLRPDWRMKDQFVVEQLQSALGVDALEDSKPMTRNAVTTSEIESMGDTICYNKGASVIRMMEHAFGHDKFEAALKSYLNKMKLGSVQPSDLWEAFQAQIDPKSTLNVDKIMTTWTARAGFPLISVTVTPEEITLKQERFYDRNSKGLPTDAEWIVPITWSPFNKSEPGKPVFWLTEREKKIKNDYKNDLLIFNINSAGFYRVMYDKNTLNRIITELKKDHTKIDEVNRAAFVDDLLSLAKAEKLDYETALKGIQYLRRERNYLPLKSAFNTIDQLIRKFKNTPDKEIFENFVLSLISDAYHELSFDDGKNDDHLKILLRQELNKRACSLKYSDCVIKSMKYFKNWRDSEKLKTNPIPKNQRSVVYSTAIQSGTYEDWEFLYKQYKNTNTATEQTIILNALGYTQNKTQLEQYLIDALTKPYNTSLIRKQDLRTIFSGIQSSSPENAYYLAEFVEKNYDKIKGDKEHENDYAVTLLTGALQTYPTNQLISKVQMIIYNKKITGKPLDSLNSSLKKANDEIDWFNKYSNSLTKWIKNEKNTESTPGNTKFYRLPKNIIPQHYELYLSPDIEKAKFTGTVVISADVKEDTDEIILHSDQLDFEKDDVEIDLVYKSKFTKIKPYDLRYTKKYQFHHITLGQQRLEKNSQIKIHINNYKGTLNKEMRGFYISHYKDKKGNERGLAATHLEPTGARRMFPCFDEPALKATFDIKVSVPDASYKAISNMDIKSSKNFVYEFNKTPPMSTYLVAVVVSDFESLTDESKKYSVYANPIVKDQLKYSLEVIGPTINFFEKILGVKYELPKLDMVALPDFSSGAMENWGLLTYRETGMLYDPVKMSTTLNKQSIRNVIAHEISHQWFGDLVGPDWWNVTWLNEGFARYYQYHAYTDSEKSWDLENQFVTDALQTSMVGDATTSTHPITSDVWSPKEIKSIFDNISYAKAGSIIRMVENLLGRDKFHKALQAYLTESQHKTGTPDKLFKAFQKEVDISKFNVANVMNTWTTQSGYPVVDAVFEGKKVTLKQSRFFLRQPKENTADLKWDIPITYISKVSNGTWNKNYQWFVKNEDHVEIPDAEKGWVILNANQIGYYRVNYDKKTWSNIIKALNSSEDRKLIPVANRAGIIDDLMSLGRAGLVDYGTVFSGLSYLRDETDYIPWKAFFNNIPYITRRFEGRPESYDTYKKFLFNLLEPSYKRLGIVETKTDKHTDVFLRKFVLDWLCKLEHKECVKEAVAIFKKETDKQLVPPSQRSFAYCTGIRNGTVADFDRLMIRFKKSDYATEQMTILGALACSKDAKLLKDLLKYAITPYPESRIRFQDAKSVFTNVLNASPEGMNAIQDFIISDYKEMQKYFGDHSIAQNLISTMAKRISTKAQIDKLKSFANALQSVADFKETLISAQNRANNEIKWYEENAGKIYEFIRSRPENLPINHRLEITAMPTDYDIYLDPYFKNRNFTFDGKVIIDMIVSKETFEIILHANDLEIKSIKDPSQKYKDLTYKLVPASHKLIIYFKSLVPANTKLKLEIVYMGHMRDDMKGFYRSSYVNDQNQTRWIASTQFEPTHARRAFPCFDEPSFKATFTVHIMKIPGYSTLSNMASERSTETLPGNKTYDKYGKSVIMSPYVLAFIVSDFVGVPKDPNTVTVWSRKQLEGYMKDAAVLGEETLEILNGFTLISYPLKQMHLVAIPDFSAGAMENWGLVTFREYGLSYNETTISASYKRYVVTTVAHELVHMWFGNLVTCDWWDYTWLNEGFADYLSYLVSDQLKPSWHLTEQFVVLDLHTALEADASETSHPMNNKVNTPTEAQAGFDTIAYKKAGSVLRMLRDSFGHTIFRESIHNYLDSRKFKTAKSDDLVKAFQERANWYKSLPGNLKSEQVTEVMNSWIEHAGYPLIKAVRSNDTVSLTQERFLLSDNATLKAQVYQVPITYTTETIHNFTDTKPKLWLGKDKKSFSVTAKDSWYILNIQEIGFYRVNYDENNWKHLIDVLNSDKFTDIHVLNRAQLIDDSFNLARAGVIGYNIPFDISNYLKRETNHLPWKAFFNAVAYLSRRIESNSTTKNLYSQHMLNILSQEVNKAGYKEDSSKDQHLDQLNKELLMTYACKYMHEDCKNKALEYFKKPEMITPNIAAPIYCKAIQQGGKDEWISLWERYETSLLASDYITILKALGCSRNEDVLQIYLDHIFEKDSKVRRQDTSTAVSAILSSSQEGWNKAIDYFHKNLQKLKDFYGDWESVGSLFSSSAGYITSQEQVKKLDDISKDTKAASIKSSLESAMKTAKKNADWYGKKSEQVHNWLSSHYKIQDDGKNSASAPTLSLTFLVCIILAHFLMR